MKPPSEIELLKGQITAYRVYAENLRGAINLPIIVKQSQIIRELQAENDVLKALLSAYPLK